VISSRHRLTQQDSSLLLDLIYSSLFCTTEEQLVALINEFKRLFSYEFAVCALHRTQASIDENHFINVSFPPGWCRLYVAEGFDKTDPIVRESARNGNGLQYWPDTYKKYDAKTFVSCAQDFGLREGYSHGIRSPYGDKRSHFSFAGRSVERHPRTELILEYAVPHLDRAFNRIVGEGKKKPSRLSAGLSSREREILSWAKDGKSTWEISVILSISKNTVKFHLKNIMEKLQVVSRTQAVAVALQNGLIRLE
jgi:DNA-binding CsgD family transcriptional regulator